MVDDAKVVRVGSVSEVRQLAEHGMLILGSENTLRSVRAGRVKKVFVSSTAPKNALSFLERHGVLIITVSVSSADLGVACKRPFPVAVVGVVGEKDS